jgi:hypothetical protein
MFYPGYSKVLTDFVLTQPAYLQKLPVPASPGLFADEAPVDVEIKKYFTFNSTGNIMISSTSPDGITTPEVRKVFEKVVVLFGAITAAMALKDKDLYDYSALEQVIERSGLFIIMRQEDRDFAYTSREVALNTAIITGILGAVSGPEPAMKIAVNTLASIGSTINASLAGTRSSKEIGNLLFVCEDLMGMPIVSVQLFGVKADNLVAVAKSNCSTHVKTEVSFKFHQNTYMLEDPEYINQFSNEFPGKP